MRNMLVTWASEINAPWFSAGVGLGIPACIAAASYFPHSPRLFSMVILLGGLWCGLLADHLSQTVFRYLSEAFTCYDVLMKGAGPACLILVTLSRGVRDEPAAAVKPAAFAALAALVIEPAFAAFVTRNLYLAGLLPESGVAGSSVGILGWGGQRRKAAAAAVAAAGVEISRARWLAGAAQVALWAASMRALGRMALRVSRGSGGTRPTLRSYLSALKTLASGRRGSGIWFRREIDTRRTDEDPQGEAPSDPVSCPTFERGEVTVRGLYCTGLDTALTGRWAAGASSRTFGNGNGNGADGGGGGSGLPGGDNRPFYVSIALGNITARTSVRTGFSPTFTEVFPLGINCPIRGAVLTIHVIDSFENGRSGRGDRLVGEAHVPIDSAELVPESLSEPTVGVATYRLAGDWKLHGIVGPLGPAARVGAEVVVKAPPTAESAAGKFRRRESVGWYAR